LQNVLLKKALQDTSRFAVSAVDDLAGHIGDVLDDNPEFAEVAAAGELETAAEACTARIVRNRRQVEVQLAESGITVREPGGPLDMVSSAPSPPPPSRDDKQAERLAADAEELADMQRHLDEAHATIDKLQAQNARLREQLSAAVRCRFVWATPLLWADLSTLVLAGWSGGRLHEHMC